VLQPYSGLGHLLVEVSRSHAAIYTTLGRSLDEGSARRTDLYLTIQSFHKRQASMSLAEFEPAIPASVRPRTFLILGLTATGIDTYNFLPTLMSATRQGCVVSRQTLTADTRVQPQASPRGIYGTQNGNGAGFCPNNCCQ